MCKNNGILLEFVKKEPRCSCGRATCGNRKNLEYKVFDGTLVFKRKNEDGGITETIVKAGFLARDFMDINNLVAEQITPQIPVGASLVSVEIRSV